MAKNWYSIKAQADKPVEISIYDEIGHYGVTAREFISELRQYAGQPISLSINSPGGSVFDALAIYNALRQHDGDVGVTVMGVAASAASLVAMAGDTITMPENAFMMVHNPLGVAMGNAEDMREVADLLDKLGDSIIGIYAARTSLDHDGVKELLDAETWLTAADAAAYGFADAVTENKRIAASYDTERMPGDVRNAFALAQRASLNDYIASKAKELGVTGYAATVASDETVTDEKTALSRLTLMSNTMRLCNIAGYPQMAPDMIDKRMTLPEVSGMLLDARATADEATHTDSTIPQASERKLTGRAVWDAHFSNSRAF